MENKIDLKNMTVVELLEKLSYAFGPSGCEDNVIDLIEALASPYADEISRDRLGTLIVKYSSRAEEKSGQRLMLCAHADEVGFMIKSIDSDGFLKIKALSGKDSFLLAGRHVTVGNEERKIGGIFGAKAIHLGGVGEFDSMFIDIGAKDREEAEKYVAIGDFGIYDSDFVTFGEGGCKMRGKALDDRFGCAVLLMTLLSLYEEGATLPYDVYFAFTRREEIGASGAGTAANMISPTHAVVIEATAVNDIIGDKNGFVAKQGEGGCISLYDRGTVYPRDFVKRILALGEENNIPVQLKRGGGGANDTSKIQRSLGGVKVAAISAPSRYIHSGSNVIDRRDLESVIALLGAVARNL